MDSDNESKTKGRAVRGRGRGRGRPPGRPSKKSKKKNEKSVKKEIIETKVKVIEKSVEDWKDIKHSVKDLKTESIEYDENIDSELTKITSFVTNSSTALHRNEPLNWKYRVNLIGEKVVNPRIHCCDKCLLPILVYGRMIACKHVFCLSCAKGHDNVCPRCGEKVLRVETSGLGTVFMCQTDSCKRTYLSQRDLQAHIQHRHVRRLTPSSALNPPNIVSTPTSCAPKDATLSHSSSATSSRPSYSTSFQSPIPVVSSRSNLITVPIQEEVNPMTQTVNSQTSMIVSTQQPVSNYVPTQPPYGHHNPHLQWPNTNAFGYRPPWSPINPYAHNPYNRPFFPQ